MRRRRRFTRGQAMLEMALAAPLIMLLCLGGTDMSQAYLFSLDGAGAARAGMKAAIIQDDIGDSIRAEPNTLVSAATAWGQEGPGGTYACTTPGQTSNCGDPNGCTVPLPSGQSACFAVRTCSVPGGGSFVTTCPAAGTGWGALPTAGAGRGIQVKVVIAYSPYTPLIAHFAGTNGTFYLTSVATGLQLY